MLSVFKVFVNKIKWKVYVYLLKGDKVICGMCDWKGIRFPESRCPKCMSLARTRLIPYSIKHFALPVSGIKLLHVAPNLAEFGFVNKHFTNIEYDRLNIVKSDHINIVQDLTKTNIASDTYDLIIIWHVLEHIPDDQGAISEMKRMLKPDGRLLVCVPIHPPGRVKTYEDDTIKSHDYGVVHGHHDHCRSCGLDYYERFESLGFTTDSLDVKDLDIEDVNKFGLSENHVVWMFRK